MAGVSEGVTIEGILRTQKVLADLLDRTEDLSPLMAQIGAYGEESTVHRFETQKGPDGKAWEKSARAKATGGATLDDSGRLKSSITWNAGRDYAEWGSNVIYAGAHQFGLDEVIPYVAHNRLIHQAFGRRLQFGVWQSVKAGSRNSNLPARPMFGINDEDDAEISDIISGYLSEAIP